MAGSQSHALQIFDSLQYIVNTYDSLASSDINDSSYKSDEGIEVDESLYRCYLMVQEMLREANGALNSPKPVLLLIPALCEIGRGSVANTAFADVVTSPILVSCMNGLERVMHLLRVQQARNVPLPSSNASGWLRCVSFKARRWLYREQKCKQT